MEGLTSLHGKTGFAAGGGGTPPLPAARSASGPYHFGHDGRGRSNNNQKGKPKMIVKFITMKGVSGIAAAPRAVATGRGAPETADEAARRRFP